MCKGWSNAILFFLGCSLFFSAISSGQQPKAPPTPSAEGGINPEKAIALAQQGRCKEAIPALKKVMGSPAPVDTRKTAGMAGLRCALSFENRDAALDFLRLIEKQFPNDPDVLFVLVHAYSDLSTGAAQNLARTAPQSIPAHKLNAEALEAQGKWDEAIHEYEGILAKQPNAPGIHYSIGRMLLMRTGADAKVPDRAKEEFQKELKIDPNNAGAHYVLGELAAKDEAWEEAIKEFTAATKLDPTFADAYVALGLTFVTINRYQDAIEPLRVAERFTPGNPAIHYGLGTALARTGRKEESDKEFAIHRSLTSQTPPGSANQNPQ